MFGGGLEGLAVTGLERFWAASGLQDFEMSAPLYIYVYTYMCFCIYLFKLNYIVHERVI